MVMHIYMVMQNFNSAVVRDNGQIGGNANIYDNACIYDYALISGNALICGTTIVCGPSIIRENAIVKEDSDYIVFKNWWSSQRFFTWTKVIICGLWAVFMGLVRN